MQTQWELNRNSGLVVIDVQQAFNDPAWGQRNHPEAEANIAALLAGWRTMGFPVFHVRHASASPEGRFRRGESSFDFKLEATPMPGEPVYTKSVNSAFIGTRLEQDLRARKIDTLVIVGLTTNHCVSTTARMSGNFGFTTYVVEDATASFERPSLTGGLRTPQEVHESALSDLREEFAEIVSTTTVLEALAKAVPAGAQEMSVLPSNEIPSPAAQAYIHRITAHLQGRQPLDVLGSSVEAIEALVAPASEGALLRRPGPGKWSAAEILAHLADTETVLGFRLKQILSQDGVEIAAFDQDRWAVVSKYQTIPATRSVARLAVNREAHLELLKNLTPEDAKRYGVHAERGRETVEHLCRMWAGHDLNHLAQLRSLLS